MYKHTLFLIKTKKLSFKTLYKKKLIKHLTKTFALKYHNDRRRCLALVSPSTSRR